jgi:uncharacterized damage-inducible protein DinB
MSSAELILDGYARINQVVHQAVEGLTRDELTTRVSPEANTIGWLVWHLARVQDDHLAQVRGTEQVWTAQGWSGRFELPFEDSATGYSQSAADVSAVRAPAELLLGYLDAVHQDNQAYLAGLSEADLSVVVDESWTPPVTLSARLISVLSDDLQHAGQAAFIRGIVRER